MGFVDDGGQIKVNGVTRQSPITRQYHTIEPAWVDEDRSYLTKITINISAGVTNVVSKLSYISYDGSEVEVTLYSDFPDLLLECTNSISDFVEEGNGWVVYSMTETHDEWVETGSILSDEEINSDFSREKGKFIFEVNGYDKSPFEGQLSLAGILASFAEDGTILHAEVEDTEYTDLKWWGMGLEKDVSEGLVNGVISIQSGIKGINFEFTPNEDESLPQDNIPLDDIISDTRHDETEEGGNDS
jgi:hypothetical protein